MKGKGLIRTGTGIAFALAATALLAPASSSAAVNCSVAGSTLQVDITAGSFAAFIERGTGPAADQILVRDGFSNADPQVNCGSTPTVTTIDAVNVDELASDQGTVAVFSLANGALAPGLTNEGDGSSEIEVDYDTNADNQGTDQFNVNGGPGVQNVRFGSAGGSTSLVNLNGDEVTGIDSDATLDGVERTFSELEGGNDVYTGDGTATPGAATPTSIGFVVNGGAGDDTLRAGSGANDSLNGDIDNDTIVGGINGGSLGPGPGNDTVTGGASSNDFLSYLNLTEPVVIDLGVTAPQNTVGQGTDTISGLESFVGTNGGDQVTGTNGPNTLVGGQLTNDVGGDLLVGLDGADILSGANGSDILSPGPGADSIIGGPGSQDMISYANGDAPGITLTLDPLQTEVAQNTGGSGIDTLDDDPITAGTDHGIENINGSQFADSLTGNDAQNLIVGGAGIDTLNLGGDADQFSIWDGIGDTVNCGGGADSGEADEVSPAPVDTVNADCETVDYAPQTTVASGPADGSSTTDSTPLYTLTSDEPASFTVSVDGGAAKPCPASCEITTALSLGPHVLVFRAVDSNENMHEDLTPVTRNVTIVAPPVTPTTPVKKCKKGQKLKKGKCARKKKRKK